MRTGDLLRFFRNVREMSQSEVAIQYGVDRQTYRRWENNLTQASYEHLEGVIEGVFQVKLSKAIEIYNYVERQTTAA